MLLEIKDSMEFFFFVTGRMFNAVFGNFGTTTGILLITGAIICFIALSSYFRFLIGSPGPWGLPLFGYFPFLRRDYHVQLHELAQKHGEVYFINLAGQTFLYLDSSKAIREAYLNKSEFFSSRSNKCSIGTLGLENTVSLLRDEPWRVIRKFLIQSMREIGLNPNKEELKGPIGDAVRSTLNALYEAKGESIDVSDLLSRECTTAVCSLFLGERVSEEDKMRLHRAYIKTVKPLGDFNILLTGTLARYFYFPRVHGFYEMIEGKKEMTDLLYKILSEHKAHFELDQQPSDLIDLYLREKEVRERKRDPQAKHFTDSVLVSTLVQIFGDGSSGIGYQISAFLQDLSLHPEAQDALFEEITREVGTERLPTWEDRNRLPLMYSTIKELFRRSNFVPVIPGYECSKETTVLGVRVPEGCITLANFWAVHNDFRTYKDPDRFDITRFLPGPSKQDDPIAFGIGKRACAGETLVMSEVFTFLASLLQNFLFLREKEKTGKSENDRIAAEELFTFKLRAIPRSSGKATL